ncbi:MAG: methyltransferase domain-containing protein [Gemmatimonadaceae bacterium]
MTAIRPELLEILCSPGDHLPLTDAGDRLTGPDRRGRAFPVVDGIPVFVDPATLDSEKLSLHRFYESYGWRRDHSTRLYKSHARFGFGSPAMLTHRRLSNLAQKRWFDPRGRYFLDCASGAIPAEEYLEYSAGYDFHVCADLTLSALAGAREKLRDRGLYVNCDATVLPFQDGVFDAILCSHTLYHIPADQQQSCVREFARVLKPGRKCIIYYNVGQHSLIGRAGRPLVWLKRATTRLRKHPPIYSHHYPREWFEQFRPLFRSIEFHVYRLLPNQVMKYAFPNAPGINTLGRACAQRLHQFESADRMLGAAQYLTVVMTR